MNRNSTLYKYPGPATIPVDSGNRGIKEFGQFNVFHRENCKTYLPYSRRDYFKISLILGQGKLHYADRGIEINKSALLFSNPNVPYAWEATSEKQSGYFCLFREEFFISNNKSESLHESAFFRIGGTPVFFINEGQVAKISGLYEKMIEEMDSEYIYKYDLLRNYVNLVIHEALKLQPVDAYFKHTNASSRIASLFVELMERQFPIDSPEHILKLKTANDYAERLSIHVNHLNRAVKEVTGKTTTEHIADRITNEAKALLKHTDWNISEIAYSLGFEYPAYFNNFFKKQTTSTPNSFRQ